MKYRCRRGWYMNKNELIAMVADKADLSKAAAGTAVDAVFDGISGALSKGDEVRLVGFGTFSVAHRAATEGRNPQTGDKIKIPASKSPKFKAGKSLKDAVNG
ncbi:MAG: HU family DNA-binding protein [Pseudomonadota bacterium]